MKEFPIQERIPEHKAFSDRMIAELSAIKREKRPVSTVQCASTQATLDRDPALDAEWWARPLPESAILATAEIKKAMATGDIDGFKRLINQRDISPEEMNHVEATRRRPKNSIGQSEAPAHDEQKLEIAKNAYDYAFPVEQIQKEQPDKKRAFASKFMHMLWKMGLPVDRFIKKELNLEVADGK